MKKKILILTMLIGTVLLSFSACKSKTETPTNTTEQTYPSTPALPSALPTTSDIINQISIPNFANPEVTKFCNDFKDLMIEYAQSKGSSDAAKEAELEHKFTNWANRATQLSGKIQSDELVKFNDFITNAQTKFAEMANATSN